MSAAASHRPSLCLTDSGEQTEVHLCLGCQLPSLFLWPLPGKPAQTKQCEQRRDQTKTLPRSRGGKDEAGMTAFSEECDLQIFKISIRKKKKLSFHFITHSYWWLRPGDLLWSQTQCPCTFPEGQRAAVRFYCHYLFLKTSYRFSRSEKCKDSEHLKITGRRDLFLKNDIQAFFGLSLKPGSWDRESCVWAFSLLWCINSRQLLWTGRALLVNGF